MKILFLTNNENTTGLQKWLTQEAKEDVAVIQEKLDNAMAQREKAEFLISYNYRYIITKEVLDLFNRKAINLHISLLPWNRGAHPNLWSFLEDTPKGVTIHCIDSGIDAGNIILQKEVFFNQAQETLASTYAILQKELEHLFMANWDAIKRSQITPQPQKGTGSLHSAKEFSKISYILGKEGWNISIPVLNKRFQELQNANYQNK